MEHIIDYMNKESNYNLRKNYYNNKKKIKIRNAHSDGITCIQLIQIIRASILKILIKAV